MDSRSQPAHCLRHLLQRELAYRLDNPTTLVRDDANLEVLIDVLIDVHRSIRELPDDISCLIRRGSEMYRLQRMEEGAGETAKSLRKHDVRFEEEQSHQAE
jgi:hypothetical protein